jgi:hypothetical protein
MMDLLANGLRRFNTRFYEIFEKPAFERQVEKVHVQGFSNPRAKALIVKGQILTLAENAIRKKNP